MTTFIIKHFARLMKIPVYTAGLSFFLGTLLLLLHLISPKPDGELLAGLIFTLSAFVINAGIFIVFLALCCLAPPPYRQRLLIRMAVMLLNMPVAIVYIIIVINFS